MLGIGALIVVTGSMEPNIHIKEAVIIKSQEEYHVQDIITYRDENYHFVTHRIVEIQADQIVTKGDNNTINDLPIHKNQIQGKVCYHSLLLGKFFLYWIKPILILVTILLFLNIIFTRRKNEKTI